MPGHGSHWECIYESVEFFMQERFGPLIHETPLNRTVPWVETDFDGDMMDTLYAFSEAAGDVRFMALVFHSRQTGANSLATAYPLQAASQTGRPSPMSGCGYKRTLWGAGDEARFTPDSGHRRRKNASDSKSGHWMSALPPKADVIG